MVREPSYRWVPDNVGTFGDEIIGISKELAGLQFDGEQELAIKDMAVHDKFGKWAASEVCIVEPRQNGKTNRILIPFVLWDLFSTDPDMIIWTAHRWKTSNEAFDEMKEIIEGTYEFRRRVKKISESHGDQIIELVNGATLVFLARSGASGRGLGGKRPVLDEAYALQSGQMGALLPTILARPNAQIMYASSAGQVDSDHLRGLRDRGRKGGDNTLVYLEWCAPGSWDEPKCELVKCNHHRNTPGCALDRKENYQVANPAFGKRISERNILTLRRSMTPKEFGREVLGWWDEPLMEDVAPIKPADWYSCADELSRIAGPVCMAIDVAADRKSSAIAVCGRRADGIMHGELIRYDAGTEWVVSEVAALAERLELVQIKSGSEMKKGIVLDTVGPVAALLPDLNSSKIDPVLMSARNMSDACGALQDAVTIGASKWRHLGQPQVDLAIEGAIKRDIGDGGKWGFGRKRSAEASVDICPLIAITAARWGLSVSMERSEPSVYVA